MNDRQDPLKIIGLLFGCFFVVITPILGILVVWDFDLNNIKDSVFSFFGYEKSMNNYAKAVQPGEDSLLTSTIINEAEGKNITPRSNPAVSMTIKSADINGPIVYGQDGENLLKEGFWLHPASVYPGDIGVSVIFGHRRHYLPPAQNTFYNLDKVKNGDRVEVKLEDGSWLEYSVTNSEVVDPDKLSSIINSHSDKDIVKFITCTPLGTSEKRLVVTAERVI